jgi:hypothetical protein
MHFLRGWRCICAASVEKIVEMAVKHVGASEEISTRIFKEIVNE